MTIKPHSPEWFQERSRRVTGSVAGAILGLNRYKSRADVMDDMLRAWRGEAPTFTGNQATEWGSGCESGAIACFTLETGYAVEPCGMYLYQDWLSATPDGLIADDGTIEVKCPYSKRKARDGEFSPLRTMPHYHAQIQIELLVTNRAWTAFYQWSPFGSTVEYVMRDEQWLADNLPLLRAFYDEYLGRRACN